jgi:hypothetical protein
MNRIYWIYIIDDKGATIFSYENIVKGYSNGNHTIISNLIYSLQSIAKDLTPDTVKNITLGNNRFFLMKEKLTNYLFISKTDSDADQKYISLLLKEVMHQFTEKFTGHFTLIVDEKIELLNSFKEDVRQILMNESRYKQISETVQEA